MAQAAYRLFAERGYSVSLAAIAAEAGVAVQTVQFTYHTKLEVLKAALQHAIVGEGGLPPHEQDWFDKLRDAADQREALATMVRENRRVIERAAPLVAIFETLRDDPDAGAFWRRSEELRHEGMGRHIKMLGELGPLREGLDEESAADILFLLLSPNLYSAAVSGRGWTPERWQTWTTQILAEALL
jgi:AcrR family transcriptional regulator